MSAIDEAFTAVLERHRDRYNARFAHARRTHRSLDGDDFLRHLSACVSPVVGAVAQSGAEPSTVTAVCHAQYDLSLELMGRGYAGPGSRYPVVSRTWAELLPLVPRFVAEAPRDFPAALLNAAYNLSLESARTAQSWLDRMLDTAEQCATSAELLRVGKVLAWRVGMAEYRDTARLEWLELDESLRTATLGTADDDIIDDRWRGPEDVEWSDFVELRGRVGGFRGFGGPFMAPPQVVCVDESLYAYDHESCWSLHADRFGATLRRYGQSPPEEEPDHHVALTVEADGSVRAGSREKRFDVLMGATSWAANRDTLVATNTRSHHVFILAIAEMETP